MDMKQVFGTARVCRYRGQIAPSNARFSKFEEESTGLQEVVDYDLEAEVNKTCLPTLTLEPGNICRYS